jgi:hypothetical protein
MIKSTAFEVLVERLKRERGWHWKLDRDVTGIDPEGHGTRHGKELDTRE